MPTEETTTPKIDTLARELPSEAIQADRIAWLSQIQKGQRGNPALLLSGLRQGDPQRWEIGIEDAWIYPSDHTKINLQFPKPKGHKQGEKASTEYVFDQEAVWLLQAHVFYGGSLVIMSSKRNHYYYPAVRTRLAHEGGVARVNADRLIAGPGPDEDVPLVDPRAYHNHTRGNLRRVHQRRIALRVGTENERSRRPKVTRDGVIAASCNLWRASQLFPTEDAYSAAFACVYAVLEQRHPLGARRLAGS